MTALLILPLKLCRRSSALPDYRKSFDAIKLAGLSFDLPIDRALFASMGRRKKLMGRK